MAPPPGFRAAHRLPAPAVLGIAGILTALLLLAASELESSIRARELRRAAADQSAALVEALGRAVEAAWLSTREIEELASARLLDVARLVERLDAERPLDPRVVGDLGDELQLRRLVLIDRDRRVAAAFPGDDRFEPSAALVELAAGRADAAVWGPEEDPREGGMRLAAAVRRERGGALFVEMDAGAMLSFRRELGPEALVDAVAGTGGVLGLVVEGARGERLAGTGPGGDGATPAPLELDRPLALGPDGEGRLHVSLAAGPLARATAASRRRVVSLALLIAGLGLAAVAVAVARRRGLEEIEREAERAERQASFGRLAATVAHEVRNPLNALSVGVQRLGREYAPGDDPEGYGRIVALLRGEIERIEGIVSRFLELAREPALDLRSGDLAEPVRAAAAVASAGAPPGVTVEIDAPSAPGVLHDEGAVRQIVLNLVRNAIEAVGERGRIRVRVARTRHEGRVVVLDDGPGIAPAERGRVFEYGTSGRTGGTGLGLFVVLRLARAMGGDVEIDSPSGGGAEVSVRLPLAGRFER